MKNSKLIERQQPFFLKSELKPARCTDVIYQNTEKHNTTNKTQPDKISQQYANLWNTHLSQAD